MGRIAMAIALSAAALALLAGTGCGTTSNAIEDAGVDAAACAAAGGSCITGGALTCPITGPQPCGAKSICCLVNAIRDAGADSGADGPTACVAAGGECLVGGLRSDCAVVGPQDCNPDRNPGGSYCCLQKAGVADAAAEGGSALPACQWPASLNDAGPGACAVGRAYVKCDYSSGGGCLCISDGPTSCPGCAGTATCTNMCAPNEYAVSCGGPPLPLGDGSILTYQQAPAACVGVGSTPAGNQFYCCPCE